MFPKYTIQFSVDKLIGSCSKINSYNKNIFGGVLKFCALAVLILSASSFQKGWDIDTDGSAPRSF